jgi:hypothetical protein
MCVNPCNAKNPIYCLQTSKTDKDDDTHIEIVCIDPKYDNKPLPIYRIIVKNFADAHMGIVYNHLGKDRLLVGYRTKTHMNQIASVMLTMKDLSATSEDLPLIHNCFPGHGRDVWRICPFSGIPSIAMCTNDLYHGVFLVYGTTSEAYYQAQVKQGMRYSD